LRRVGTTVSGDVSADGSNWTNVGSTTLSIPAAAVAGLVVCSVATNTLNTSTFDNVTVTGGSGPPPAPGAPASPSPANGATGVATTPTLTWSATGATSYDVKFGATNPPAQVSSSQAAASYTPATLANNRQYFWQIVARNASGTTPGPVWAFTTVAAAQPPGAPASPSPGNGATAVSTSPTLTWTSVGAANYDVKFGTANPPPQVTSNQAAASYAPATLANNTQYFWQIVARNANGTTPGPVWSFTTAAAAPGNIVVYAGDVPTSALHGSWTKTSDPTSPNGTKLETTDAGESWINAPVASPTHCVDVTFNANAGVPYTIWLRLRALANSKYNDAVWVQFSDAFAGGSQVFPLNSTSGLLVNLATDSAATSLNAWGWQNGAYWLSQPTTVTFGTSGSHTLRIQLREDGVQLDQIVLSPSTYLNTAPGSVTNDNTIVPKP
jgi:hypothetical protein